MNLKSAIGLCVLFLYFGYHGVHPIIVENEGYCGFSDEVEDLCSSYCYQSVKGPLFYILELKDQMKVTAKENEERIKEIKQLKLKQNLQKNTINTNEIENLHKSIDAVNESVQIQNQNIAKIIKFIGNIINNQDYIKSEIEQLRNQLLIDIKELKENKNTLLNQVTRGSPESKESGKKSILNSNCKNHSTGIHNINIPGINSFPVLCNEDIADGGWLVIHKRFDGSENFNRNWNEFREGFGSLDGEFFIGLEKLHQITKQESYELYIQFVSFDDTSTFVSYANFRIQNEENKYLLEPLTDFKGTEYDGMWFNHDQKFTTFDQDNDQDVKENCAEANYGAWWYNDCDGPNLNGKYSESLTWDGVNTIKSVQMLIRPKSSE